MRPLATKIQVSKYMPIKFEKMTTYKLISMIGFYRIRMRERQYHIFTIFCNVMAA